MTALAVTGPSASLTRLLRQLLRGPLLFPLLLLLLATVAVAAMAVGAAGIPLDRIPAALGLTSHGDMTLIERDRLVLLSVRLPRIAIAIVIGALLASSGAIMQGLFRNPLADPALVGVSSGGALAAAAAIVASDRLAANFKLPFALLPLAAFCGSLLTALILKRIATRERTTSIAIFLLAGLAIGALAGAGIGLLVFVADDRQLRDITFWMLGSLGGATWEKVGLLTPFLLALLAAIPFISRGLDLLVLGEAEAFHVGIPVERLKRIAIVLVAASSGAAVAFAGVVGFVGIVVPHLLRLVIGPAHRNLLPASAVLGAILLLAADTAARTLAAPAEVPIGVLTALVGAPFFLALLLRQRGLAGL
ncbi:FecCD family ABC transporter permease [Undibacter mobilis]|uniref:Iron ABC transporter n=1 Tax=Undibacter mobilis TaxID=2292256 RepID=A0A371B875_9BRAD|nr:iron chelate uptake ABC transporter family permease subunit [Undibacter mobilis]RDV03571.1 iron ABC transporter [Undibacter mobilis]